MSHDPITKYGLTAVPAAAGAAIDASPAPSTGPSVIPVSETAMPTTALARRTHAYAQKYLPVPTYNHSMRVYHYGLAMKQYRFANAPEWAFTDETYFLASLLHDIGLTGENLRATKLSFEFYGGYLALDVLRQRNGDGDDNAEAETKVEAVAPRDQAESIAEAIIRHQDLCDEGTITALGQLLQMATLFDNIGSHKELVHPDTIADVTKHFPRLNWSHCFTETVRKEVSLKPWAHSTALGMEAFPTRVLGNTLMAPYESGGLSGLSE